MLLTSQLTLAQQKPVISQYMFNGLVLNPAYAGVQGYFSATALHRNQWVNFDGAPVTSTISGHTNIKGKPIGVGMFLSYDKLGVHDDLSLYGSYSYQIKAMGGTISMGLQAGFNQLTSQWADVPVKYEDDPFFASTVSNFKMNFGTGLYYFNEIGYLGFSIPYLIKNRTLKDLDFQRESTDSRYYYLSGGLILTASPFFKIKPSALLRVEDGMPIGIDTNLNFYLDDVVNIGASYRSGDSFITQFELQVNNFVKFGYAYDWILSEISRYSNGTHEIMLNYRLNLYAPRKSKMCPGPFYF
jgi:type IX secretion system PorP/SprF family membrane protein